jgi:hypothetical protein
MAAAAAVLACTLAPGCSSRARDGVAKVSLMGEPAEVGQLIYTVTDSDWFDQLGEPPAIRLPQRRFLVIHLSVTNSGGEVSGVPRMRIEDARGTFEELADGRGVPDWFGGFRLVQPAETETGAVVFDAPLGAYRLRVINDADEAHEVSGSIEIPIQVGPKIPDLVEQLDVPWRENERGGR